MVTNKKDKVRQEFSDRMHEACADLQWDNVGRNRPKRLCAALNDGISQKAVEKWFDGKGFPQFERIETIANILNVNLLWLFNGTKPKRGVNTQISSKLTELQKRYLESTQETKNTINILLKIQETGNPPGKHEIYVLVKQLSDVVGMIVDGEFLEDVDMEYKEAEEVIQNKNTSHSD